VGERSCTHIGVELPDEAGEVVVLEVVRQHVAREGGGVPDDEAVPGGAPGDDPVERRLAHQVIGLGQERRRLWTLQQRLERARWVRPMPRHQLLQGHEGPRGRQRQRGLVLELGLQQRLHRGGGGRVGRVGDIAVGAGAAAVHGGIRRLLVRSGIGEGNGRRRAGRRGIYRLWMEVEPTYCAARRPAISVDSAGAGELPVRWHADSG
jgi:hypothetical protein